MKLTILPAKQKKIKSGFNVTIYAEHGDADNNEPVNFFIKEEKEVLELLEVVLKMSNFCHECEGGKPYNENDIPGWNKWFEGNWPHDIVYDYQTHLDSFYSTEITYIDTNGLKHEVKIEK